MPIRSDDDFKEERIEAATVRFPPISSKTRPRGASLRNLIPEACGRSEFVRVCLLGVGGRWIMQARTGTAASFLELVSTFPFLRARGVLRQIVGISERTLKAQVAKDPGATLTLEQSKRAEQVSAILSQAAKVLGSTAAADAWMTRKAIGLDRKMPLELMMTPEGCLALRDYLIRIEYGVYC